MSIRHLPRPTANHVNKGEFARRNNFTEGQVKAQHKAGKLVYDGVWVLEKESLERIEAMRSARHTADNMMKKASGKDVDFTKMFLEARARKEQALAIRAETENTIRRGELVEMADVEKMIGNRTRAFRDGLMSSAKRLAPLAAGMKDVRDIEREMETEFRYLLEQWAREPLI